MTDNHSSEAFVSRLALRGERFNSVSLDALIIAVFDFAHDMWRAPQLYKFVDHGIEHSFWILHKALEIASLVAVPTHELSTIERACLGIGTLVHDLGMQYSKYPVPGTLLAPRQVRDAHVELGYEMIVAAREGRFASDRGGPDLAVPPNATQFLHYGALVGFAHSGRKYWDTLKQPHYAEHYEGGIQRLRVRFLAALLRLADELHCEYTRIPEYNFLDSEHHLDEEGKAHWFACHYTRDIKLSSPGAGGLRMRMAWRVPEHATDAATNEIRTLLYDLREKKINMEAERIQEYLATQEGSSACLLSFGLEKEPEPQPGVQPLPRVVREFVRTRLRPYQYGVARRGEQEGVKQLVLPPAHAEVRQRAEEFLLTGAGVRGGHFRLKTGWHTDTLVQCRELCSDIAFVQALCSALVAGYAEERFTDILAVGTSAIGISAVLSPMLGTRLSSTFGSRHLYTENETSLPEFASRRVLIIDDILGVGTVLHTLVLAIRSGRGQPSYLRAFTLYSLGDASRAGKLPRGLGVEYLVAFPDVAYWPEAKEDGTCEECQDWPTSQRLED